MVDHRVELRSDTFTQPTLLMREAMAAADVGDDEYGEDPTVNALQTEVAELFGHEAALFVPTGTMANQISLRLIAPRGQELLCDSETHIVSYENGGISADAGISVRTWPFQPRGVFDVAVIQSMIRPAGWGNVSTAAISVEQTHNNGGGSVHSLADLQDLSALARENGIQLHMDGARIWHAAVASKTSFREYGAVCDVLSVSLSKGLGAPAGSLIVGSADKISRAHELRHRMGGGMRQIGFLAAAGRYALANHLNHLAQDHARAKKLAEIIGIDPDLFDTNIVLIPVQDARRVTVLAKAQGVLVTPLQPDLVRLVVHRDVDDAAIEYAGRILREILSMTK